MRMNHYRIGPALLGCALVIAGAAADEAEPLRVYPLLALNTAADETDPFLALDQVQFFFVRRENDRSRLQLGRRRPAGPVDPRRSVDELETEGLVASPMLVPRQADGWEYLYFASRHGTEGGRANFDIYVTRRGNKDEFQGMIAASPVQVVCTPDDELHPWLSADRKELYFSRKTAAGWRVMKAIGKRAREFERVEDAGLPSGFSHATLHPSGLVMFLQGPTAAGSDRQAIHRSTRSGVTARWSPPELVAGLSVGQGSVGDVAPSLSPKGDWLYFASDRPGGKGGLDLYYVPVRDLKLPPRK
jgi:hypothetical protein